MAISVIITQPNVTDSFGRVLVVGTTYSLGDDLAKSLIGQGKATAASSYPALAFPPFDNYQPGIVSGLSLDNTAAAATANTTAIQAALTAGGLVQITTPGTYYINTTLTIYSYTRLVLGPGVVIKRFANATTGGSVFQNYAFSQRANKATITLSWSSGMSASISGWTNHGCVAGDYVWLQGATLSCYNIVGLLSAADSAAGTATVQLLVLPSGAVSGTVTALKCDRDITIEGGLADYNYPANNNSTVGMDLHAINLGAVQNLRVLGMQSTNASKYCLMLGAIRDAHIEDFGTPYNGSDLVKIYGPAINVRAANIYGYCGDDGISVQPQEAAAFAAYKWTVGDCIDVHIDGTDIRTTTATGICVFYPSNTEKMIGMKASRIGGVTAAGTGVKITGAISSSDTIDSLEIDTVTASAVDGFSIGQSAGGTTVKKLIIRNLQPQMQTSAATAFRQFGSTTIESADIGIVINDTAGFGASTQYAAVFNGTYHNVHVRGKIGGGASGRSINATTSTAGGLGVMHISVEQRAGDNCLVLPGTAATGGVFIFENCDTTIANLTTLPVDCTVMFRGNKFHNASGGIVRPSSTATITVKSAGDNVLTGTSAWLVVPSGTPVVSFAGNDISIDVGATGVTKTVSGQYCFNSGSGRGTLTQNRLVTCNGTNWIQVDTPGNTF